MRSRARASVQHEDELLRVTRWDFEPGESTGPHVHGHDYVVVPVTDGEVDTVAADGTVTASVMRAGVSYARSAGVEHEVVNAGTGRLTFVEVEHLGSGEQ